MDEKTKSSESSDKNFGKERADEVLVEEEPIFKPQNELPFPTEIDLNELFPQSDKDLNDLFPDEETKLLLKKMEKRMYWSDGEAPFVEWCNLLETKSLRINLSKVILR